MKNYLAKKIINVGIKLSDNHKDLSFIIPDATDKERAILKLAAPYTSTDPAARWAFIQAIKHVEKNIVNGDIVECGVWKGGNLIVAAQMRELLGFQRGIWGYDTFAGMTRPTEYDVKPGFSVDARRKFSNRIRRNHVDWCFVPLQDVKAAIEEVCGQSDVRLIKGDVRETLRDEENIPQRISILRLDTDFYESTKVELEVMYPRIPSGGVVIIDDYGIWRGSRKAVDEYFGDNLPWLHYVNRGVRLFIKP